MGLRFGVSYASLMLSESPTCVEWSAAGYFLFHDDGFIIIQIYAKWLLPYGFFIRG